MTSFINDVLLDNGSDSRLPRETKSNNNESHKRLEFEITRRSIKVNYTEVKQNVANILSRGQIKPLGKLPPLRGKSPLKPLSRISSL